MKKIEISKKGDKWYSHCLKTGKALGEITESKAIEHWDSGTAVFVGEAMQSMAMSMLDDDSCPRCGGVMNANRCECSPGGTL